MTSLGLHEFHRDLNAHFTAVNDAEGVAHYGDALAEYEALRTSAGLLDLSFRSRLCMTGADRTRFLHGQVTNKVKELQPGQGCYAALVTAKGRLESDLYIHCLRDELLLDFESGLSARVTERLERFIVADDVQLVDVAPHYGLLSVLGPEAGAAIEALGLGVPLPSKPLNSATISEAALGEIVIVNHPRGAVSGFDLFVPNATLNAAAATLNESVNKRGGRPCGWDALEMIRIEAGLPRFGVDMDETNLAPETGVESSAVSYEKGCYIGQEVINRLRTFAQVSKALRGLRLADDLRQLPARGDKLFQGDKEVGHITSALASPTFRCPIALGYVRKECNELGTVLSLRAADGVSTARIVPRPFDAATL